DVHDSPTPHSTLTAQRSPLTLARRYRAVPERGAAGGAVAGPGAVPGGGAAGGGAVAADPVAAGGGTGRGPRVGGGGAAGAGAADPSGRLCLRARGRAQHPGLQPRPAGAGGIVGAGRELAERGGADAARL